MENRDNAVVDFSRTVYEIKKHWYYYVVAFVLLFGFAGFYMYKKNPVYLFHANMLIEQESGSGANSAAAAMMKSFSMGGFGGGSGDDELLVFQSHSILKEMVKELKLNRLYVDRVGVKNLPLYKNSPVEVLAEEAILDTVVGIEIHTEIKANGKADVYAKKGLFETVFEANDQDFPIKVTPSTGGVFILEKTDFFVPGEERHIICVVRDNDFAAEEYAKEIFIDYASTKSNGIRMELEDNCTQRGLDVLNKMFEIFNRRRVDENNHRTASELKFIDERLAEISKQLEMSEKELEKFKLDNKLTDLTEEAKVLIEQTAETKRSGVEQQTQVAILELILDFLKDPDNAYSLIPVTSGLNNESAARAITDYNNLVLNRMKLDASAKSDNKSLQVLNAQIDAMRGGVVATVNKAKEGAQLSVNEFNRQGGEFASRLNSLSKNEREFLNLNRNQTIKNSLYIYLIEQRESSLLQIGSSSNIGRVVDVAWRESKKVKPKLTVVCGLALLLTLLLPTLWSVFRTLVAKTLVMKYDFRQFTDIPVVAEVEKTADETVDFINPSGIANELRLIRNSLSKTNDKTILITSMFEGEGKSFITTNLARLYALASNKVIVVDANQTGKLSNMLNADGSRKGLTDYVLDGNVSVGDIIADSSYPGISVISPGSMASEMAEALGAARFDTLLNELKNQFDVVLVATSDMESNMTIPYTMDKVDRSIIVARSGVKRAPYVKLYRKLVPQMPKEKIFFVINAFEQPKVGKLSKRRFL